MFGDGEFGRVLLPGGEFVDVEVPSGSAWAIYSVYSHRGAAVSDSSEPVQILFGTAVAA